MRESDQAPDSRPWVVLVGGFLGAGKTTLILAAARELTRRGLRSAVILNDQGGELVDTAYARQAGIDAGEVTGGCFCCRFSDLLQTMNGLLRYAPDVIFAEPVGSCTDIVATTLRPLEEYGATYRVAPFTVLVDPRQAAEMHEAWADPNLKFLFNKQVQEADLLCFTKSDLQEDLHSHSAAIWAATETRALSAVSGQGVAAWLDEVLEGKLRAGRTLLEIDYAEYARAEAALVWLNLQAELELTEPVTPAMVVGPFLAEIETRCADEGIPVLHVKAIARAETGFVKAAICRAGGAGVDALPRVEGALDASPAMQHTLTLNLRVVGPAARTRGIVEDALAQLCMEYSGRPRELWIDCFHPAAPQPERRVVA